jgi:branched-subunit amino acid transport protein
MCRRSPTTRFDKPRGYGDEVLDRHPGRRFGSYLFRLSTIVLVDRITMPAYLERASGLVGPAAFAALAATGVATACMGLGVTEAAAPLAAVAAAVIAVLRTGSSYAAILVGIPTLWITTSLLSS